MRVLQLSNHHRLIGGSDRVFFNTLELLGNAGHLVAPYCATNPADDPSPFSRYFPPSINTTAADPRDFFRYLWSREARRGLASLIDAEGDFDVAHLHIYYGNLTVSVLAELQARGIPRIQTLHDIKLACPVATAERNGAICEACVSGSVLNAVRYRCKSGSVLKSAAVLVENRFSRLMGDVRKIDRFICVSDFQRALMERSGVPREKMTTLHNFVDTDFHRPLPHTERDDYVLYFGRIEAQKGLQTLIEAVRKGGHRLKIAGTGSWDSAMRHLISNDPSIEALGFVATSPLRDLVQRARVVVVPSEWYENCPMTVIEAKACGIPVIGSRIGAIPELVRDGVDGFLFEPGSPADLALALDRLSSSNQDDLSAAARADALARFSPRAHLDALLRVYRGVMEDQR